MFVGTAMQAAFFEPDYVYTFHVAQHVVNISTYSLTLPLFGSYNLFGHLNGQPIRFMAVHKDTRGYYWNLEARPCHKIRSDQEEQ